VPRSAKLEWIIRGQLANMSGNTHCTGRRPVEGCLLSARPLPPSREAAMSVHEWSSRIHSSWESNLVGNPVYSALGMSGSMLGSALLVKRMFESPIFLWCRTMGSAAEVRGTSGSPL
ncbi:mCG146201, partial [Mus musculus]